MNHNTDLARYFFSYTESKQGDPLRWKEPCDTIMA